MTKDAQQRKELPPWRDDWPGWHDSDKRVEIELDDGTIIAGRLAADDHGFDGEDEFPIFGVHDDAGTRHSFADMKRWRYSNPETK